MRALKRIREAPSRLDESVENLLAQFSATTLELSPSHGTEEFARRLTERAAEMFGARAAVLGWNTGARWEIAALSGPAKRWDAATQSRLARALEEQATVPAVEFRRGPARQLLGDELAAALEWKEIVVARLTGSEAEVLGVLCLADLGHELSATERQLLEALAGHASVALENVRLFSRVEQSRKQWVEDFDAISDYIVVHDEASRVLRLNRALYDLLGVRPTEAIGRDIGQLELLGTPLQPGRCPFCRNPKAAREELIHQAGDRTY